MATETQTKQDPIGIRLDGRVALVTGGNRGIGAAICRSMASQGAAIAAGYSSNRERAEQFLDEIKSGARTATIHQGNVGHAEDCERVVQEVIDQHGRLDILVNNAGITADKPIWKMSIDDWHKVININLSGAFYMSKPALEHMMERGCGRIINISSIIGQTGNIGQANYAASKSGLFGLTMTLAKEAAFVLERGGKLDPERGRADRQRRGAGLHRDRHDGGRPREGARPGPLAGPAQAARPRRGGRARRALPRLGRLVVHHRPGLGGERRDGHVSSPLGEIIRRQRELQALSMRQFARMVGISNPYLSQIERGLREPSEQVLQGIADSLKTSVDVLYEQAGVPRRRRRGAGGDRRHPRRSGAVGPPALRADRDLRVVHRAERDAAATGCRVLEHVVEHRRPVSPKRLVAHEQAEVTAVAQAAAHVVGPGWRRRRRAHRPGRAA